MHTFVIAKALVVNDANELLVLRRSQTDIRRPGQWDLPGGTVKDNEDIMAAVRRETKEEAGVTLGGSKLVMAFSEVTQAGGGTWAIFLARVTGRPQITLSFEHDKYEWLPFEKAVAEFTYERQRKILQYVADNHLLED